jgi:hypothetical protein
MSSGAVNPLKVTSTMGQRPQLEGEPAVTASSNLDQEHSDHGNRQGQQTTGHTIGREPVNRTGDRKGGGELTISQGNRKSQDLTRGNHEDASKLDDHTGAHQRQGNRGPIKGKADHDKGDRRLERESSDDQQLIGNRGNRSGLNQTQDDRSQAQYQDDRRD